MKYLATLVTILMLAGLAFGQVEKNFRIFNIIVDSADGLGIWPAAGDCTVGMAITDAFKGNELQGFMTIDSLECTASKTLMDDWSLYWRRAYDEAIADSLQESDGTGHGWTFAKVINDDNALVNFDGLTLTEGIPVNFYADFDGHRPRAVQWKISHGFNTAANDTADSAAIVLRFDEYWK